MDHLPRILDSPIHPEFQVTISPPQPSSGFCNTPACNFIKYFLIIFGVTISTMTFAYLLFGNNDNYSTAVPATTIGVPETSLNTAIATTSSSTTTPELTTTGLSTTTEKGRSCEMDYCTWGCCWIHLRSCMVRCQSCEEVDSDTLMKIHYLSETLAVSLVLNTFCSLC